MVVGAGLGVGLRLRLRLRLRLGLGLGFGGVFKTFIMKFEVQIMYVCMYVMY